MYPRNQTKSTEQCTEQWFSALDSALILRLRRTMVDPKPQMATRFDSLWLGAKSWNGKPEVYWESPFGLAAYPYNIEDRQRNTAMLLVWHRLLVSVGLLVVNWRIVRFFSGKDIQLQSSECPSQGLCPGGSTAFEVPHRFSLYFQRRFINTHNTQ